MDTNKLLMIHAYLASDGSVFCYKYNKGIDYDIRFYTEDKDILNLFNNLFCDTFNVKMKRIKNDISKLGCYGLRIKNKSLYTFLTDKFGDFHSKEWKIPESLLAKKKSKISWLKCYFDAEAYVGNDRIQVKSINKKGTKSINKLLLNLGIKSKVYGPYKQKVGSNYYVLDIRGKQNLKNYFKLVGFNSKIKTQKLGHVIAGMPQWLTG